MVRATPPFVRKWPSAVSLEALSRDLPPGVKRVGGGPSPVVISSFFYLFFSLFWLKCMFVPFVFLFFNFSPYVF
jgi:hypothetical protein